MNIIQTNFLQNTQKYNYNTTPNLKKLNETSTSVDTFSRTEVSYSPNFKSAQSDLYIDKYVDQNFNSYSPKVTIPTECFSDEAKEILGTLPLKVTFCERQNNPGYYNKRNKQAIICTVFPDGI